jgi:hypothetical protein
MLSRISLALGLFAVVLLGRGAVAYANASANWNPAFNDPTTIDVSDIGGLITKTIPYSDPMEDIRRSLLLVLRPAGSVYAASPLSSDDYLPRAHRPRGPPAA